MAAFAVLLAALAAAGPARAADAGAPSPALDASKATGRVTFAQPPAPPPKLTPGQIACMKVNGTEAEDASCLCGRDVQRAGCQSCWLGAPPPRAGAATAATAAALLAVALWARRRGAPRASACASAPPVEKKPTPREPSGPPRTSRRATCPRFPMTAAEFSIPVTDIDAGGKPFDFTIRAPWVRGALEGQEGGPTTSGKNGSLALRVSKSGSEMVVHGRLTCELEAPCARCLKPARFTVDETLSLLFVPAGDLRRRDQAAERDMEAGDADTYPYDGDTIVLDDVVRDELLLETPMIPLCSEDCPGIRPPADGSDSPAPSAGDKVDPRLAPLLRFRTNSKE